MKKLLHENIVIVIIVIIFYTPPLHLHFVEIGILWVDTNPRFL